MPRTPTIAFAVVLALLVPVLAMAHPHPDAWHPDRDLGWAIHRDGKWQVSEIWNMDSKDDLTSKYGDDFLYIRDGEERYVITDPEMVDRAARATMRIKDHTKEINALANAAAQLAMSRVNGGWEKARLEKREARLEDRIARSEKQGDDMRQMKRDLKQVRDELKQLEKDNGETLTETERRDLTQRRDVARDDLDEVVSGIRAEIREILREAKETNRAKRVR